MYRDRQTDKHATGPAQCVRTWGSTDYELLAMHVHNRWSHSPDGMEGTFSVTCGEDTCRHHTMMVGYGVDSLLAAVLIPVLGAQLC